MGNRINRIYKLCRQNDVAKLTKALGKYNISLGNFERNPRMHSILHYIIRVDGNANLCQAVYDYYGEKCLLRRDRIDATPLHTAAFHGNLTIVIWITNKIKDSRDLEYKTNYLSGWRPLSSSQVNRRLKRVSGKLDSQKYCKKGGDLNFEFEYAMTSQHTTTI